MDGRSFYVDRDNDGWYVFGADDRSYGLFGSRDAAEWEAIRLNNGWGRRGRVEELRRKWDEKQAAGNLDGSVILGPDKFEMGDA